MTGGIYRAKAVAWMLTSSTKKGTPEVAVEFEATMPDGAAERIVGHLFLTDGAFNRSIESLRYMGWTGDDLSKLEGLDANEVEIDVEEEEYEGKLRPKVRWVNRPGSIATQQPMPTQQAKSFAAAMRGKIKALDASKGNNPKPAPAAKAPAPAKRAAAAAAAPPPEPGSDEEEHEEPPVQEDDIPF